MSFLPSLNNSPKLSPELQVLLKRSKDESLLLLQFGEGPPPRQVALPLSCV